MAARGHNLADQYHPLTAKISGGEDDEGGFVSYCPELDVASQGETIDEAVRNLQDAVDTYVSALSDMGDLQVVLDERGLKVVLREPKGKTHVDVSPGSLTDELARKSGAAAPLLASTLADDDPRHWSAHR